MESTTSRPRIGVSACLLGQNVRFDGGHKRDTYVTDTLSRVVEFVPSCPEVGAGLDTPRETMRLVETDDGIRALGNRTKTDFTGVLERWSADRAEHLAGQELDGYIFMKNSPSCGLDRVKVYQQNVNASPRRDGMGIFAATLRARLPALPMTEDGWLNDPGLRETFLERLFTHHRMRTTLFAEPSRAALISFHVEHKLMYMARSPKHYRELGRLVGTLADRPLEESLQRYSVLAMEALGHRATPGRQANVLQHIVGYFKEVLTSAEKQEILQLIDEFRQGLHGLLVPLTLLSHHLALHQQSDWLARQRYFSPFPKGLSTRAHQGFGRF